MADMKRMSLLKAGLLGVLTGGGTTAASYLGHRIFALPYIPFDIFDWLARILPGRLLAFTIDTMVAVIRGLRLGPTASTAKLAEQGLALFQFILAWAVFGICLGLAARRRPKAAAALGYVGGGAGFILALGIELARGIREANLPVTLIWLALIMLGGGILLGRMVAAAAPAPEESPGEALSRRRFLRLAGLGSFAVMVTGAGVSVLSKQTAEVIGGKADQEELLQAKATSGPAASPPADALEKRFEPAPGTRPELTKTADFYRIDINLMAPMVDGGTWRLTVDGLVDRPLTLSLQDLRSKTSQTQAITLSCISNPVGGDLISTGFLTGVPLKVILQEAGLKEGVRELTIKSADGFYESVPLSEAMDDRTLLVYDMNGEPLTAPHGYPLRIYIPGHYGMKQPKWIERIEAIDRKGTGYWVDRGWSATAVVKTTSVVDAVAVGSRSVDTAPVPIGGIAYSGARGISRVEIQVDDGPWEAAELREPALSPLTWVQWRHYIRAARGTHTVRVRAYDGDGKLQETEEHGTFPDGASGISEKKAVIG
jgi:DMSO/TMAO reductase YedYZ molybdopterin-dependent catalytic subunit